MAAFCHGGRRGPSPGWDDEDASTFMTVPCSSCGDRRRRKRADSRAIGRDWQWLNAGGFVSFTVTRPKEIERVVPPSMVSTKGAGRGGGPPFSRPPSRLLHE